MLKKIADIAPHYQEICRLIDEHGFCNAILTHSYFPKEKRFILVVADKTQKETGLKYELGEALRTLLQCEVLVCRYSSMSKMHKDYWADSNRLFLKSHPTATDSQEFAKGLIRIFGDDWEFAALWEPERYTKENIMQRSAQMKGETIH